MKLLLASFLICSSVSLAIDDPGKITPDEPRPPAYALLEKLNRIEDAGPVEEMRRHIAEDMKALLDADRTELMSALNLLFTEGDKYRGELLFTESGEYWSEHEMVIRRCFARYPEEPVFDPEKSFIQSMLASTNEQKWLALSMARVAGAEWFKRDGVKAIKRLGTLPKAEALDGDLFEGMCESAKTAGEHLALLTWYVGPGRKLHPFDKGYHPLWERLLTDSAKVDLAKTRTWVESQFPPKTMRKSDGDRDWDITNLRRALYDAWAREEPFAAIQWNIAQYRDDDPDADRIYLNGVRHIAETSDEGLKAGLTWLQPFQDNPHFIKTVAELLGSASRERWDDSDLRVVGAWISALPLAMRERILIFSKNEYLRDRPRFAAKPDDRVLKLCCPDEDERKTVITHLLASLKQPETAEENYEYDAVGHEFNLPPRRMEKTSTGEALATARRRMEQYAAVTTSLDPKERLDNLPVLDWLAAAPRDALRETLQAHLENLHGEIDEWIPSGRFAMKVIEVWAAKDWQSCERFARGAQMPADTRRRILIYCFQYAAVHHPDEIHTRVAGLISDGQMWSLALAGDGSDVQMGGWCFAGRIPVNVGKGWALNDPLAVAKLKTLPPEWQHGALKGASEAFTKAEVGLGLLDWIVEREAQDPKARKAKSSTMNLSWNHWLEARTVIERLVEIDPNATRRWVEAVPKRMAASGETFDAVYYVHQAMRKRDAAAADAWLERVRPSK